MRKMPVMSTDREINDRITKICHKFQYYFTPVFFDDAPEALEYLRYELPEINIINFSDPGVDTMDILATIKEDPWLHYGGIVGVCRENDEDKLWKELPYSNVISVIRRNDFVQSFFRLFKILIQNRQILFQRDLQNYLIRNISGSLVMDNDAFNVKVVANIVSNYLYNSNYIDRDGKDRVHVSLFELLMNAVEHGNCSISYEEKTNWLDTHGDILELIREKCKAPSIRRKKVYFSYKITPERSFFSIRDEGNGFDWKNRVNPEEHEVNFNSHGHGIKMAAHYMENLAYNNSGNMVSFEVPHRMEGANYIPGILADQEEVTVQDGETVFTENEESNYLYYIVTGTLDIYSSGRYISTLTPADMFLGEMSFLLNNRRSATVRSNGKSKLIKISKNSFVNLIKNNPHYGIFLARLLANRLSKLNARVAGLETEL
jgi:hypothetical protein